MHLIINFLIYFLIFTNSTLSLSLSRRDGSLTFSISLSPLPFSSFLFFIFSFVSAFLFGFGVLLTARFSSFFLFFYIYIYIKAFMGSWKLLDWPVGIGMGEGGQAKNQRAQIFFMKILYTKKKIFWTPGPGPPLPSAWVRPWIPAHGTHFPIFWFKWLEKHWVDE